MKKIYFIVFMAIASCTAPDDKDSKTASATPVIAKDTLTYAYTPMYSSDITVPGNRVIAQKVLQVWKMFETAHIDGMKPYFADTVKYDDASGMHFYGPTDKLLAFAKSDIDALDSMRFDIILWQSAHINDRNEDWVNIWSRERRYKKKGAGADTILMQENWKVKDGKIVEFNQFTAKP